MIATVVALSFAGVGAVNHIANAAGEPTVEVNASAQNRNVNVTEGASGLSPVTVTFTLSQDNATAVSATYSTVAGTAEKDVDYVHQTGTVNFAPHETSKQVVFNAKGDLVDEANETFTVQLDTVTNSGAGNYVKGTNGTVTILDDDQAPAVSIANISQDEGNGDTTMKFIVTLSSPAGADKTYYAFTKDQPRDPDNNPVTNNTPLGSTGGSSSCTPANPNTNTQANTRCDYVSLNGAGVTGTAVTVGKGKTTAELPVTIRGDLVDEFDEHFEVILRNENDNTKSEIAFATATIKDDDANARLDVADPAPVTEDNTACDGTAQPPCTKKITFSVTLSAYSEKPIHVDYATANRSATSGSDYTSASGSHDPNGVDDSDIHFNPGDALSKPVDVFVRGDATPEPDERFAFNLSNSSNADIGDGQAFGLILDNDNGSFPTVSIGNAATTAESSGGNPGTASFTVTVSRPMLNTQNVTVFYTTADGPETGTGAKAVAGSDYVAKTSSVDINFPQTTATITVNLINDAKSEADEFFQVQLTDASNASITDAVGEAKITDEDPAPTLSIADKTVTEGTSPSATAAPLTVTLSSASGQEVTVFCSTPQPNSGTASSTEPADYGSVTNQKITFAPGETSKTCDLGVIADSTDEPDETVAVSLSNPSGATINDGSGVLTITDDDNPPTVTIAGSTHTEESGTNKPATFRVSLSAPSGKTVTVTATTADGTAKQPDDYTAKSQVLTFNPGEVDKDFQVTVIADTTDEPDETFTAALSAPSNATLGNPSSGTVTVQDDDLGPNLSINNATVTEGNSGTTNAVFTVTKAGDTAQSVTVKYATADGTATQPSDYTSTSGTLTFAANETTKTINVPVKGDTTNEPDEGFTVVLTEPSNATLADDTGNGTITNDDSPSSTSTTSSTTTSTSTTSTSTTSTTVVPPPTAPKITTSPGPGGGPHIKTFNANGTGPIVGFMDGSETAGKHVARGDVNGDGVDEIITGSGPNSAAVVSVYSASGNLIASNFAYNNGSFYGGVFVAAGDLDGDGKDEVITGAGPGGGPLVITWKVTGSNIATNTAFYAYGTEFAGGVTVGAGDLDGDGKAEIVTGPGAGGGPHVRAFTASGGVLLNGGFYGYTTPTGQPNWTGGINVAAGDLDGDGKSEIVVAPWPGGGPHLRLFNHDGSLLNGGIMAGNPSFNGGVTVAVGDLTGDNKAEILVGSMTQQTVMQVYNADLSKRGDALVAYPGFGGGVFVSIGKQ